MVFTNSLPEKDELLISINVLEHLRLLPRNWLFNQTWEEEGPALVEYAKEEGMAVSHSQGLGANQGILPQWRMKTLGAQNTYGTTLAQWKEFQDKTNFR